MEHLSENNNTTEKALNELPNNDDDTIEAFGAMRLLSSTVLAAAARGDRANCRDGGRGGVR